MSATIKSTATPHHGRVPSTDPDSIWRMSVWLRKELVCFILGYSGRIANFNLFLNNCAFFPQSMPSNLDPYQLAISVFYLDCENF